MGIEALSIVLLVVVIAYHGYGQWLWQKERAFLVKTFEEEKRAVAAAFDSKMKHYDEKKSEMIKAFVEETQNLHAKYMAEIQKVYGGGSGLGTEKQQEIPPGMVGDLMLAFQEEKSLKEFREKNPDFKFTGIGGS